MTSFWEKHRKQIFWLIIVIAFFMIYAYNLLTPYSSDDMYYMMEVKQANSFWDLVKQQYGEYISNSGRVVGQFNVRLSLAAGEVVFNIVNSLMFVALVLIMYASLRRKKKYDIFVLLLIITFLWKGTTTKPNLFPAFFVFPSVRSRLFMMSILVNQIHTKLTSCYTQHTLIEEKTVIFQSVNRNRKRLLLLTRASFFIKNFLFFFSLIE